MDKNLRGSAESYGNHGTRVSVILHRTEKKSTSRVLKRYLKGTCEVQSAGRERYTDKAPAMGH